GGRVTAGRGGPSPRLGSPAITLTVASLAGSGEVSAATASRKTGDHVLYLLVTGRVALRLVEVCRALEITNGLGSVPELRSGQPTAGVGVRGVRIQADRLIIVRDRALIVVQITTHLPTAEVGQSRARIEADRRIEVRDRALTVL